MGNEPIEKPASLEQALRNWIVIAGYVIGGWFAFEVVFLTLAFGYMPVRRGFVSPLMTAAFRLSALTLFLIPFVLLAGCWGFKNRRPWGRPALLTYACAWLLSTAVSQGIDFVSGLEGTHDGITTVQMVSLSFGSFDRLVFGDIYPALLLVFLTRPAFRRPTTGIAALPAGA